MTKSLNYGIRQCQYNNVNMTTLFTLIILTIYLIIMTHDHDIKSENYEILCHNYVFSYVAEMCFHNKMHIVQSKQIFCMHGIPR